MGLELFPVSLAPALNGTKGDFSFKSWAKLVWLRGITLISFVLSKIDLCSYLVFPEISSSYSKKRIYLSSWVKCSVLYRMYSERMLRLLVKKFLGKIQQLLFRLQKEFMIRPALIVIFEIKLQYERILEVITNSRIIQI